MSEPTRRELLAGGFAVSSPAFHTVSRAAWEPAYISLGRSGKLSQRASALSAIYRSCRLCPRRCQVDRTSKELGVCGCTARAKVSSAHPHFGEERPLVGSGGSGTIFFSGCSLRCEYCQNWTISHKGEGSLLSDEELARLMIRLQHRGCHNINLVTPTHFVPSIVQALRLANGLGLRLPIVYNCGGYEPVEMIRMLDGIVDIYLPDFKYMDGSVADKFSAGARDYPEVAAAAIEEMHSQVGNVVVDERGIALRGLMIRHLVLPYNAAGTDRFVRWVAKRLGPETYVNIMGQYRPEYHAYRYPELSRRITPTEFGQALAWAKEAGLRNLG